MVARSCNASLVPPINHKKHNSMKKIFQLLFYLLILSANSTAQNFTNGDLEGEISGVSTLPPFWQIVSFSDINCQADSGGTSPDLINATQPAAAAGVIGSPYSGNIFVGGSH